MIGSLSAMDGSQKSEDYGYYETKEVKNNITSTPIKEVNVVSTQVNNSAIKNEATKPVVKDPKKENIIKNKVKLNKMDHSAFDALLKAHVTPAGKVDYAAIKTKINTLNEYISSLSKNVPNASLSKNEQLAFWINAYNANTIKLIVDNYPVASIMDIHSGKAFDKKWISMGGETLSLNDIENNKIRAKFDEPRIHFAVNCAAKSCPPILNKAWTAANVQSNLEARTKAFINDGAFNKISTSTVQISKIFEWYAKDFPSDIVSYLIKYSDTPIDPGAKVTYIEYDWALNKK